MRELTQNANTVETNSINDVLNSLKDSHDTYVIWRKNNLIGLSMYELMCIACDEIKVLYCEEKLSDVSAEISNLFIKNENDFDNKLIEEILIKFKIHNMQ